MIESSHLRVAFLFIDRLVCPHCGLLIEGKQPLRAMSIAVSKNLSRYMNFDQIAEFKEIADTVTV